MHAGAFYAKASFGAPFSFWKVFEYLLGEAATLAESSTER